MTTIRIKRGYADADVPTLEPGEFAISFQANTLYIGTPSGNHALAGSGDVTGPGSSTDNAAARFDGAGGKTLQNSVVIIDDAGAVSGVTTLTMGGALTITGSADAVQLTVKGNGTQTNNIVLVEKSDGTDLFTIDNNGRMTLPVSTTSAGLIIGDQSTDLNANILDVTGNVRALRNSSSAVNAFEIYNKNTTNLNGVQLAFTTDTTGSGAQASVNFVQFRGLFAEHNNSTAAAALQILVMRSGTLGIKWRLADGVQVGAPTGGDKGLGWINLAGGIALNNTNYANPDYCLEHYFTGRIERFIGNPGASKYNGLVALDDLEIYLKNNLHLPNRWDSQNLFEWADMAQLWCEELAIYITQLHNRIKVLESRIFT